MQLDVLAQHFHGLGTILNANGHVMVEFELLFEELEEEAALADTYVIFSGGTGVANDDELEEVRVTHRKVFERTN